MGYEIHIERIDDDGEPANVPISLHEWINVVEQTNGVRLAHGDWTIVNSKTGEIICCPNNGGDAEVYSPNTLEWIRVFKWNEGTASFKGLPEFENPNDTVRKIALLLAYALNAKIVGDDGEFYE